MDIDTPTLTLLTTMQGVEFIAKSSLSPEQLSTAKAGAVATLTCAYALAGNEGSIPPRGL